MSAEIAKRAVGWVVGSPRGKWINDMMYVLKNEGIHILRSRIINDDLQHLI